jgi:DNA-binding IclR family transcriptional regulator
VKLTKRGPNTITGKRALLDELEEIQSAGFAVDDEELAVGVYAIAVPVRNEARDVVAAVGLAAPGSAISLEELVDALAPHVVSTASPPASATGATTRKASLHEEGACALRLPPKSFGRFVVDAWLGSC